MCFGRALAGAASSPRVTQMIPTQDCGQCSEKPSGKALFLNETG